MNEEKSNMKVRKETFWVVLLVIAIVGTVFLLRQDTPRQSKAVLPEFGENTTIRGEILPKKQFKILHIMSYHSPWKWTDDQFQGFKEALSDLNVEYEVVQMDTKRQSSERWKRKIADQAKQLIETWKPDLVFANDDNAQEYVIKDYVNTDVPCVFSAVNAEPGKYGFEGSKNVTGVLERMHFVQTVRLLKQLVPDVHRIAIITDSGKMWGPMIERMKQSENELPRDVEIVDYYVLKTFKQYKKKVKELQGKVDAIGFLGVFEFKGSWGINVTMEKVQQWTVENSSLPDFTFWKDRVDKGVLCAVTVSGLDQGREAGKIARGILVRGHSPSAYPVRATEKGVPVINLARAEKLNLKPKSNILLTAEVVTELPW